ncbi:MAG: TrkA C-terminal domain-containing protein [Hyphomicrobiales bacterium]
MNEINFLHPYLNGVLALFLVLAIGSYIGKLNFKGISLGLGAVLIVGMIFGLQGVQISKDLSDLGIALYLYVFAVEAGPIVLGRGNKDLQPIVLISFFSLIIPIAILMILIHFIRFDEFEALGIFAGSMTNSAGLAAIIESMDASQIVKGFSVAYIISNISLALFIKFAPKLFGFNIAKEEKEYEEEIAKQYPPIIEKSFTVENERATNKTLEEIEFFSVIGCMISEIIRGDKVFTPSGATTLKMGDIITVVGTEQKLNRLKTLIGNPTTSKRVDGEKDIVFKWLTVRNPKIISKTYAEVKPSAIYQTSILKVKRGSTTFSASPDLKFRYGDQINITCEQKYLDNITLLIEGNDQGIEGNLMGIFAGIIIGSIIGQIDISIGSVSVKPGIFNGVLIAGLILGRIGKSGPFIWSLPRSVSTTIEQFGISIFLALIGVSLGTTILSGEGGVSATFILVVILMLIIPAMVIFIIGRYKYKMPGFKMMGLIAGIYGNVLALSYVQKMTKTNQAVKLFAVAFPLSAVMMVIFLKIIFAII